MKTKSKPPMKCPIVKIPDGFNPFELVANNITVERFQMGDVSILKTHKPGVGLHLSLAHPRRLPTWDEVKRVRYELLPLDKTFAMLLPPPEEYTNLHEYCFQMIEVRGNCDVGVYTLESNNVTSD